MAAVQDYASLSQAIQDYWVRSDIAPYVDYFIQAAQDTIDNDILTQNEGRGVAPMEVPLTGTINATTGTLPLPAGYLALRNMQVLLAGSAFPLQRKSVEFIYNTYPLQSATDTPAFIARQGQNFVFGPFPDQAYQVQGIYWQSTPILSATAPTNWLTSDAPTLLLNACNIAVANFLRDPQALQVWQQMYQQQLVSLIGQYKSEDWSGSALAMTPA